MIGIPLLTCLVIGSIQDPLSGIESLETKHYTLVLAMDTARRDDTARLVETAWTAYAKELDAKPKSKAGERSRIYFYRTQEDWQAGMQHQQEFPLPGATFVHHSPERDALYLHDELNRYHARKMLLYGLFLQFHYRIKTKNEYLGKEWFITGMADALSTHRWDGETLELGARLSLDCDNRAKLATTRGILEKLQDGELTPQDLSDWDMRWALSAFLMYGEEGSYRKSFQKRALGGSGSMLLGHDFLAGIGDVKRISGQLDAWVREQAVCLSPVVGTWREEGRGVTGEPGDDQGLAIALCDPASQSIQVDLDVHSLTEAGLILDWRDGDHFTMALVGDDVLRLWEHQGQSVQEVQVTELSSSGRGTHTLRARIEGDEVALFAGKRELARFPSSARRLGVVARVGQGVFRDISFR